MKIKTHLVISFLTGFIELETVPKLIIQIINKEVVNDEK